MRNEIGPLAFILALCVVVLPLPIAILPKAAAAVLLLVPALVSYWLQSRLYDRWKGKDTDYKIRAHQVLPLDVLDSSRFEPEAAKLLRWARVSIAIQVVCGLGAFYVVFRAATAS